MKLFECCFGGVFNNKRYPCINTSDRLGLIELSFVDVLHKSAPYIGSSVDQTTEVYIIQEFKKNFNFMCEVSGGYVFMADFIRARNLLESIIID